MGERGPLRYPLSTRGLKETGGQPAAYAQNPPPPPSWLTPKEKEIFRQMIDQAIEAGIPMEKVDGFLFANMARLQLKFQREKDGSTAARIMRTLAPLLKDSGLGGQGSRRRIGVVKREKKLSGALAVIAARREQTA